MQEGARDTLPGALPSTRKQAATTDREDAMKGTQKPRRPGKKPAQKTLKERRAHKRAAAKQARPLDV